MSAEVTAALAADSLLPPSSTASELVIENAMRSGIDISAVSTVMNPQACPAELLPFLASHLAISRWDSEWTEAEKREAVAGAIPFHQRKGTRAAVEEVLKRFHPLLNVREWFETTPRRDPHTFEVRAPAEIGADFLTIDTADAIIRDVATAKPLRSHFDFVQTLDAQARMFLAAAGMGATMFRADVTAEHDTSRDWSIVLQTEDGEPVFAPDGADLLETS